MKIIVKAKPKAKEEKVERVTPHQISLNLKFGEGAEMDVYKVSVKEPPVDGRANEAITKALAKHFGVSLSQVRLVSGARGKKKIFEIK